jgi:hypothetical protein
MEQRHVRAFFVCFFAPVTVRSFRLAQCTMLRCIVTRTSLYTSNSSSSGGGGRLGLCTGSGVVLSRLLSTVSRNFERHDQMDTMREHTDGMEQPGNRRVKAYGRRRRKAIVDAIPQVWCDTVTMTGDAVCDINTSVHTHTSVQL